MIWRFPKCAPAPDVRAAVIEELALDFENSKQYVWDHYEVADRIRALLVSRPDGNTP